jgi:hypothetical protein
MTPVEVLSRAGADRLVEAGGVQMPLPAVAPPE